MTKRLINWVVGVLILPLTVVISLSLEEYAWASSPTEQLRGYTDQVMKALENPTLSASAPSGNGTDAGRPSVRRDGNRQASPRAPLAAAHGGGAGEFVQLFRDLLERGYLSRIGEYGGEQINYVGEQIDGDHAIVRALIVTKKGTQVPIESRLLRKADRWLIYDVLVENVSLIASYRSQFDRVIRTTSYEELVRRLKSHGTS
jgi:phospholipid transport system substrate-binding protein